jgi:hypothetical protein
MRECIPRMHQLDIMNIRSIPNFSQINKLKVSAKVVNKISTIRGFLIQKLMTTSSIIKRDPFHTNIPKNYIREILKGDKDWYKRSQLLKRLRLKPLIPKM